MNRYAYVEGAPETYTDALGFYRAAAAIIMKLSAREAAYVMAIAAQYRATQLASEQRSEYRDARNYGDQSACELYRACLESDTNLWAGLAITGMVAWDTAYRETAPYHAMLDMLGYVDQGGIGGTANAANAILYLLEGDYKNALLSTLSAIPWADLAIKNPLIGPLIGKGLTMLGIQGSGEATHYTGLLQAQEYVIGPTLDNPAAANIGSTLSNAPSIPLTVPYPDSGPENATLKQIGADGYLTSYARYDGEGDLFMVAQVEGRNDQGFATGASADFYAGSGDGSGVHPHSQFPAIPGTATMLFPAGSWE